MPYGDSVSGSFTLVDDDIFDIGGLSVTMAITSEVLSEDCMCASFDAAYQTNAGQGGIVGIYQALS